MIEKNNNTKKMSFGETIKFLITGKKPDGKILPLKNNTQQDSANIKLTQEEKFEQESGMTLKQAEALLEKWYKGGDKEKLTKGSILIGKYFPHHFSQKFLQNINENKQEVLKKIEKEETSSQNKNINPDKENEEKLLNKFSGESLKEIAHNPLKTIGVSFEAGDGLPDENEIEDPERLFGAIAYIPFFSVFVILTQKQSPFAQFHAWQAFAFLAIIIAITSFKMFFFWIPGFSLLLFMSSFLIFLLSFFSAITAFKGKYINIPVISSFAKTLSGR